MPSLNSLSFSARSNLWELSSLAGVFGCLIRGGHYNSTRNILPKVFEDDRMNGFQCSISKVTRTKKIIYGWVPDVEFRKVRNHKIYRNPIDKGGICMWLCATI